MTDNLYNKVVRIISQSIKFDWLEPYKNKGNNSSIGSGFFIDDKGGNPTFRILFFSSRTLFFPLGSSFFLSNIFSFLANPRFSSRILFFPLGSSFFLANLLFSSRILFFPLESLFSPLESSFFLFSMALPLAAMRFP